MKKYLPEGKYHDLMVIKSNNETAILRMKEPKNDEISEIVLTVLDKDKDTFFAIGFSGKFTLNDAKKMSRSIKTDNIGKYKK